VRILNIFLLVISLLSLSAGAQTLILSHTKMIDVATGKVTPGTTVVIEGNKIVLVTQARKAKLPAGKVVDAKGAYLIPGLWDMHTHVYFDHTAGDGTDLILPLLVANGITGIRDMGSNLDSILEARAKVAAHTMLGPRMVVSGPMLDGAGSSYGAAIGIVTPEDGRKAVDMLHGRGVDFIKVQSGVPRDAYFAIADEAKKVGVPFEGHVPDRIRAAEAVAAGQRTFEHLIGIFEASSPDEDKYLTGKKTVGMFLDTYDPKLEAKMIALLAEKHIWQCPTLYWERGQWLVDAIDYAKDPDLAYAGKSWVTKQWPAAQKSILKSLDTDPLPVRERFVEHELGIVKRLHAAGVPFLAGTDTPAGVDVLPGISLHLELQRFVAAEFTPLEALQTATLNPALFYKRNDLGGIEAGKLADLVLLEANPLADISNTRKISGVVLDGRYLSETELGRMKGHLREVAAAK